MSPALFATPGQACLSVKMVAGQSAVTEAWSSSPLKLLTPRSRGPSVWAYLSSFGGGLVQGDQTSLTLNLGADSRCFLTTQASTKVYRNPSGRPCSHDLSARLRNNSVLVLAPDPVQSFADSSYHQTQQFHLDPGAGLVLLDWFCSGRAARGECWSFNRLRSRNDVFIGGKRRLLDSLLLDRAHGPLAGTHRLGRFNCVAMLSVVGGALQAEAKSLLDLIAAEPLAKRASLIFSGGPIREGALMRVAGERFEDVARCVYQALGFVRKLLHDDPWTRKLCCVGNLNQS